MHYLFVCSQLYQESRTDLHLRLLDIKPLTSLFVLGYPVTRSMLIMGSSKDMC